MGRSKATKADIAAIQYAIERYFGRQIINYKDCIALCNDVYKRFEIKMSAQTIRRFFGLVKSKNDTSITTLNILARYIEYNGWEDFIQSDYLPLNALSAEQETFIRECFNIIILPSEIIYPPQDVSYYQISYILATRIVRHDFSASFIQALARNSASQLFFYEMFPYCDGLAGKYAEGINEYIKAKKTNEGYIFGHCLLFLRDFLIQDVKGMRSRLSLIQKKSFDLNIYPIPVARYAAAHFMYAYVTNDKKEFDKWIKKSTTDLVQYYNVDNEKSAYFPGYYIKMIEFLLLVKEFEHAKNLIEIQDAIAISKNYVFAVHVSYTEVLKLHNIVVATFTNNKAQANKFLKDFQIDKIWIFDKKYYTMWYLIAQYSLTDSINKKAKFKAQLNTLIAETKFTYFGRLFEELCEKKFNLA